MKIMVTHTSATALQETPHDTETTRIPVSDVLRDRAQLVINDTSIDPQWRTIIGYALEINDPWLAELLQRARAGENFVDAFESMRTAADADESIVQKIEALAEIICRAGDEPPAALVVLMRMLEDSMYPKEVANIAKHFAFTYCAESNLYGLVDAQIAVLEAQLLASNTPVS
jgi:hypothetical protein